MKLTWRRARRTLRYPFQTARGRRDHQETIIVSLEHDGITALGEACAMTLYGHTLETIEVALAAIAPKIAQRDPFHIEHMLDELLTAHDDQRAAVAAVDMALHDWIGKRLGIPTMRWLGLDASKAPLTDITIGIDEPATIAQKVREAIAFPAFKVKVGVPDELEIIRTIRHEAPKTALRLDANSGWTASDAESRLRAIMAMLDDTLERSAVSDQRSAGQKSASQPEDSIFSPQLQLLEQPVPPEDHVTLRRLKNLNVVPIIADESCVRQADVLRLAGVVDGINIKLNKCGGIREARKMIYMARSLGLKIMLGCTSESAVGVAAAAQLAPLADWIDLDTHLLAKDDEFTGLGGECGRLTLGQAVGLGIRAK